MKADDEEAASQRNLVKEAADSALTGRSLEEIAAGQ